MTPRAEPGDGGRAVCFEGRWFEGCCVSLAAVFWGVALPTFFGSGCTQVPHSHMAQVEAHCRWWRCPTPQPRYGGSPREACEITVLRRDRVLQRGCAQGVCCRPDPVIPAVRVLSSADLPWAQGWQAQVSTSCVMVQDSVTAPDGQQACCLPWDVPVQSKSAT